jgi:hypothetical protein
MLILVIATIVAINASREMDSLLLICALKVKDLDDLFLLI